MRRRKSERNHDKFFKGKKKGCSIQKELQVG